MVLPWLKNFLAIKLPGSANGKNEGKRSPFPFPLGLVGVSVARVAKGENKSRRIAEVVLVGVGELVGISSQQVVNLCWPERNDFADRNVDTSAKRHGERIVCRRSLERASAGDGLANLFEGIRINIGVRRTEQNVSEWVESMCAYFDLRTKQIRE